MPARESMRLLGALAWGARLGRAVLADARDLPGLLVGAARAGLAEGITDVRALLDDRPTARELEAGGPSEGRSPAAWAAAATTGTPAPTSARSLSRAVEEAVEEAVGADDGLRLHVWPDGGVGHTSDLWAITPDGLGAVAGRVACGQRHPDVDALCHRRPGHTERDVIERCEGYGDDGNLYWWRVISGG